MSNPRVPLAFLALLAAVIAVGLLFRPSTSPGPQAADTTQSSAPPTPPSARTDLTPHPASAPARLELPAQNHTALIAEAEHLDRSTNTYRFATRVPLHITPQSHGTWTTSSDGRTDHWHLELTSPGATSLNFAFAEYHMPDGGELVLSSPGSQPRPFTAADNESHGQLWTPLLRGDQATLTVSVPAAEKPSLKLTLAAVNHGFRGLKAADSKIGGDTSGACNIDVACASAGLPISPLIVQYADQVRAVGAYTLNGIDMCSGSLINNTAGDGRPLFLTADHCGIDTTNAPSMVTYWNFENPTCRTPGSAASGAVGDGPLDQFNTGATFLSTSPRSDFCLVELDDPIPTDANVFFAGWDRSGTPATSTVGIHHPAVAEKRISFDFDPTTVTGYYGTESPGDGTHLRVADWDEGTTEGGSSGSPLFDQQGRIIGQLHGGDAACGNDAADWYGALSVSWDGGGTPSSRLRDWLDPTGSGTTSIGGQNQDEVLVATASDITEGPAGDDSTLTFTVTLSEATADTVTVTASTVAGTATAGSDYTAVSGIVLTFLPGTTQQTVDVTVHGDDTPEEHETLSLVLSDATNAFASGTPATVEIRNDDFITPVITNTGPLLTAVGTTLSFPITALNTPTTYGLENPPPGASVDPLTGRVSFTPATTGPASLVLTASNPAGSTSATIAVDVSENPLLVALDIDPETSPASFPETGGEPWSLVTDVTSDGTDAASPPPLGDGGSSSLILEFTGPEALTALWKVSSEGGYDYLELYVDGAFHDAISGEVNWRQITLDFPGPGTHTIEFRYTKDGSESDGDDTGWVDAVTFASTSATPFVTSPVSAVAQIGLPFSHRFTFFQPPSTITPVGSPPDGFEFDPETATLSGTPTTTGNTTFSVIATDAESDTTEAPLDLTFIHPLYPSLELEPTAPLTTAGNAFWSPTTTVTHDGADALRSGVIGDNQNSSLSLEVQGPDTLIFWWKVSSEEDFDLLDLLLDDQVQQTVTGEVDWHQRTLKIPGGTHTVTWNYSKDSSSEDGDDAGYVDQVTLASSLTTPLFLAPATLTLDHLKPFAFTPETAGAPTAFSAFGLPPGLDIDPVTGAVTGTPTSLGNFPVTLTASNANGSADHSITFVVVPPIGEAVEQPSLVFTHSGDARWTSQTESFQIGGSAARSGDIGDDQSSVLSVQIEGPAAVSFRWRVSSEEEFDYLDFFVDDQFRDSITGITPWAQVSLDLAAGVHTLTWNYGKDGSESEGDDAGYIDDLNITPTASPFTTWLAANGLPTDADPAAGTPPLLARYALGLPATTPVDLSSAIALGSDLSLTITRDPTRTDVTITVEASPDLTAGSWSTTHLEILTDTASQLTVRPLPDSPAPLYLRPRFTLPTR